MQLIPLAARVCKVFSEAGSNHLRTVQKVKQDQVRDVVTQLDVELHNLSTSYVTSQLSGCKLLSEEGGNEGIGINDVLRGKWLVVDPLDGSNNYALKLPGYGYMASYIDGGFIKSACVVLPEHDQYIVVEGKNILTSKPILRAEGENNAPIYYAYPPKQDTNQFAARIELQKLIDSHSSGMYRSGSACIGLYNLIERKHIAFIGHSIRIWDALAFLPILRVNNIKVHYYLHGLSLTLVASHNHEILKRSVDIFQDTQGITLQEYEIFDSLKVGEQ